MEDKTINSRPLKVLHFVHWSRSGITSLVKNICDYDTFNSNSLILLSDDSDFENFYSNITDKIQLQINKSFILAIFNALRFYKFINPDIVHAHSFTPLLISCLFFWKSHIIFHVHSYYAYFSGNSIRHNIKRFLLKLCTKRNISIICVSKDIQYYLKKYFSKDTKFVKNAIPDRGASRNSFHDSPHRGRFYTVSRLDPDKNIQYAIDLIERLFKLNHNVSLHIYGEGKQRHILQKIIDKKGLNNIIKLAGFHNQPNTLPDNYDFYISTSKIEGFGLSMLDALRAQIPLIMTKTGELLNTLVDKKSVYLLELDISKDVSKLEELILLPGAVIKEIQNEERKIFKENFSMTFMLKDLTKIYYEQYQ